MRRLGRRPASSAYVAGPFLGLGTRAGSKVSPALARLPSAQPPGACFAPVSLMTPLRWRQRTGGNWPSSPAGIPLLAKVPAARSSVCGVFNLV